MKIHRFLFYFFLVPFYLSGCAAALVPVTNDPWIKYSQAMNLFKAKRPIPAERLLSESLEGLTKTDQYGRLALVQFEYADFIASPLFQKSPAFANRFTELGGESGVARTIQQLSFQAETNVVTALSVPSIAESPTERTQLLILLIDAQARQQKNQEACKNINRAIESYAKARDIKFEYVTPRPHGTVSAHLAQRKVLLNCEAQ